jgi:class 3 adenylate cyclase
MNPRIQNLDKAAVSAKQGIARGLQTDDAFPMQPLTLSFKGALEQEFIRDYHRTCIKTARFGLALALLLYCGFGLLDPWIVPEAIRSVQLIRFGIVSPIILVMVGLSFTAAFERVMEVLLNLCVLICGFGIIAMVIVAPPPGRYFYYAGLLLCAVGAYTLFRVRFIYASLDLAVLLVTYEISAIWITPTPVAIVLNNSFFFVSATVIGMSAGYYIELYTRRDFVQKRLLKREQEKSEALLLNILPAEIVKRLKEEGDQYPIHSSHVIVDRFSDVTILFADIVGFTDLASRVSPEALVVFLNEVFSKFDALADVFGLEKIKTIGDAYMAVSGLLVQRTDHPEAAADMALQMQRALNEFDAAKDGLLQIRIGLHTGPVVAGVIGTKKFSYDMWGNAVNVANRMERSSPPGKILVSEATYNRLRDHYAFTDCGEVDIKGKGRMKAFFLVSKRSDRYSNEARNRTATAPLVVETDERN